MIPHFCCRCQIYYESDTHKDCHGLQRKLTDDETTRLSQVIRFVPALVRPFVIKHQSFWRFQVPNEDYVPEPRLPDGHRMSAERIADIFRRIGRDYAGALRA